MDIIINILIIFAMVFIFGRIITDQEEEIDVLKDHLRKIKKYNAKLEKATRDDDND